MDSISKRLRALRVHSGQGLKRVAPQVGITYSYLSKVENGVKKPSADLIVKLCKLYGADADELLIELGELPPDVLHIFKTEGKAALNLLRKQYGDPSENSNE